MGEDFRKLIRWLADLHAPLGRWSPLAATGLFLGSHFLHSTFLRTLAYGGASVLLILIAADIARSFVDPQSYPERSGPGRTALTWPMLAFRVGLTAILGSAYAILVFIGIGPWFPLFVLPVLFVICLLVAWRNVDLWYEQGAEFEEELKAEEGVQHAHAPQVFDGPVPGR